MNQETEATTQTNWREFLLIVALCWGWFAIKSIAVALGVASPPQLNDTTFVHLIAIELCAGAISFFILKSRGWAVSPFDLGISWSATGAGMFLLLLSFLLYWMTYAIGVSIGGSDQPLRDLSNSISVSWSLAIGASIVNGIYEEVFLVWFIFNALESYDIEFVIGVSVLLRILAHVYQGPIGTLGIFTMGVLFAFVYARYRQIWPLIVAHAGTDILALVR